MTITDAVAMYEAAKADSENWNTTYEDIARYFLPQRRGFTGPKAPGEEKTEYMFDSIGVETLEDLSNYVASVTTPAGANWFKLQLRDKGLNGIKSVREWLQDATDRMHEEIRESNFEPESSEFYKDYCGFA